MSETGDRRTQFNNYISEDIVREYRETISRKYGLYAKNQWSYELEQLLKWYNSVDGRIPKTAHTHKNRIESNIVPSQRSNRVKVLEQQQEENNDNSLVVPVNDDSNNNNQSAGFGFNSIPESSPLMQFIMKKTGGNWKFEERHYALAERLRTDPEYRKEWHEETIKRLRAKARRIDYLNYQKKLQEQDRNEIRPEMRLIKQDLVTTDSISDKDRVRRDQLHRAFVTVTGKTDKRTFDKRLMLYEQHEYFSPVDPKGTAFRALQKFLEI